jgi:hypothetical protein
MQQREKLELQRPRGRNSHAGDFRSAQVRQGRGAAVVLKHAGIRISGLRAPDRLGDQRSRH